MGQKELLMLISGAALACVLPFSKHYEYYFVPAHL